MRAGTLRDRVIIEKPVRAVDASGAAATEWSTVTEVAAQIFSNRGAEFFRSDSEAAEAVVTIRIRELPGIPFDPAWRLVDKDQGTIFDVVSIQPSRKRNDLSVICRHGGTKRP